MLPLSAPDLAYLSFVVGSETTLGRHYGLRAQRTEDHLICSLSGVNHANLPRLGGRRLIYRFFLFFQATRLIVALFLDYL
jgi:hypothetical protein